MLAGLLQLIEKSRSKISTDLDIIGSIDVASGLAEVAAEQVGDAWAEAGNNV